ncbi:MAG: general secretion pathway protein GspD [Betaproteobacteria bacterium]|nr:MAG: general secretion pathway protein GspD [Betaproteobacteria bacterium]
MKKLPLSFRLISMVFVFLIAGCSAQLKRFEANQLNAEGKGEESVIKLQEAAAVSPRDAEVRRDLINRRTEVVDAELASARRKLQSGSYDEAEEAYRKVLRIDSNHSRALSGLEEVEQMRRLASLKQDAKRMAEQGKPDKALEALSRVAAEMPSDVATKRLKQQLEAEAASHLSVTKSLNALYPKPISLEFRDAPVPQVLEALARTANINFVLDKDVRPDLRATLFLRRTYLEDAVNLLLATNRLEKKYLNERSVLIYSAEPAKTKEYQDLVVRAFYLNYGDAKQVAATLKTLLKVREAIPDEKLNMILVRDTPEAIALAERIVTLHEIPDPEVMLEVEILEVTRNKLMELGIQWPSQVTLTPLSATGGTTTTLYDLNRLNDQRIQAAIGNTLINAKKTDSDVNLLANPRIRVRSKSKAKILIGDRVPIITTTSTSTGFVSETVQYVDVGLKLEVEPRVAGEEDVSIKIGLEVSSLVKEIKSSGGTLAYQIGTRNADTILKLRDGETQILAGLLNDEERSSGNRVPVIGDIPILGRLFGSQKDERAKTEIILSITPRIVQSVSRPTLEAAQFWSGSESTLRTRPLALPSASRGIKEMPESSGENSSDSSSVGDGFPNKAAAAATTVELTWKAPPNAKLGETVTVGLKIKTDGAIRSLPFQVGFDPAAVEIIKVEDGGFFKTETGQAGLSTNVDLTTGKLFASLIRNTVDGPSGEGMAAVISMRVRSADKPIELKLLGATPISLSNQVAVPQLPPPMSIQVTP